VSGVRGSAKGVLLARTLFRRPSRPSTSVSGRRVAAEGCCRPEPPEEYRVLGEDPHALEEGVNVVKVRCVPGVLRTLLARGEGSGAVPEAEEALVRSLGGSVGTHRCSKPGAG
jgi:hypothetical protein